MATPVPGSPTKTDDDDGVIRVETNLVTMPVSVLTATGVSFRGCSSRILRSLRMGSSKRWIISNR